MITTNYNAETRLLSIDTSTFPPNWTEDKVFLGRLWQHQSQQKTEHKDLLGFDFDGHPQCVIAARGTYVLRTCRGFGQTASKPAAEKPVNLKTVNQLVNLFTDPKARETAEERRRELCKQLDEITAEMATIDRLLAVLPQVSSAAKQELPPVLQFSAEPSSSEEQESAHAAE